MIEKCPGCKREINYSLIPASAHPDADFVCYDCLPDDMQKAYDKFFGHNQPLYSIGTWDTDLQAFTPQEGVPAFNLTRAQLVSSIRQLQDCGYSCHRFRSRDETGNLEEWASDSDPYVMINRTDGMPEYEILEMWKR